jgi:hypothetical protein
MSDFSFSRGRELKLFHHSSPFHLLAGRLGARDPVVVQSVVIPPPAAQNRADQQALELAKVRRTIIPR